MARNETPWRSYLTEDQLLDTEASLDLNKLCWYCEQLCIKSKVLNDRRWYQPFQVHRRTSRGRRFLSRWLTRSDYQNFVAEQGQAILNLSLGDYTYRSEHLPFHPNGKSLLSSVQAGCHLCTMLCWTGQWRGQRRFDDISQSFRVVIDRDTRSGRRSGREKETHYTLSLQNDALGDLRQGEFCRLFLMSKGLSLPLETEA